MQKKKSDLFGSLSFHEKGKKACFWDGEALGRPDRRETAWGSPQKRRKGKKRDAYIPIERKYEFCGENVFPHSRLQK